MADEPNAALSEESVQFLEQRTGPVPGQSLTNSTDNKYPWEQPPRLTNRKEAEIFILEEVTTPEAFIAITDILGDGIPVDIVTRTYLLNGFGRGLWDTDLMLLLVESVAFIFMALAEKLDIDYELYAGDKAEDGAEPEEQEEIFTQANTQMKKSIKKIHMDKLKAPSFLKKTIEEKIEELPEETITQAKSLLSRDEPIESQVQQQQPNSLLGA